MAGTEKRARGGGEGDRGGGEGQVVAHLEVPKGLSPCTFPRGGACSPSICAHSCCTARVHFPIISPTEVLTTRRPASHSVTSSRGSSSSAASSACRARNPRRSGAFGARGGASHHNPG